MTTTAIYTFTQDGSNYLLNGTKVTPLFIEWQYNCTTNATGRRHSGKHTIVSSKMTKILVKENPALIEEQIDDQTDMEGTYQNFGENQCVGEFTYQETYINLEEPITRSDNGFTFANGVTLNYFVGRKELIKHLNSKIAPSAYQDLRKKRAEHLALNPPPFVPIATPEPRDVKFFVTMKKNNKEYGESYCIVEQTTKESALRHFITTFNGYTKGQAIAEYCVTLYEAGKTMGEEEILHQLYVTMPTYMESYYKQYAYQVPGHYHPQDPTEFREMPTGMLDELEPLTHWEYMSFPNGSNYYEQKMPKKGKVTLPSFGEIEIFQGYIQQGWNLYHWSSNYTYIGGGTNLGIHFNTQDKALSIFL